MGSEWLFVIQPATWVNTSLGEVVDKCKGHIQTGPFGSQLHASDYVAAGIPSIMPKDIGENRIESAGIAQVSNDDAVRLSKHRVIPGDIIYSRRGDVEKRAIVREDQNGWLCGTGCIKIRTGSSVIQPKFLYYYLGHPIVRGWIKRHAIGATMPNLNTSIIRSIPISLPPLPEQRAIAHILGTLDDKIECNRRMNETLEKMAQAIFKSWFVDFDPVRWNMDAKNGKAVGKPPVPPEILKRFPDSFQESELGLIPKGWEVGRLGQFTSELRRGIAPKYSDNSGVRVINQKCVRNHRVNNLLSRFHDDSNRKTEGREVRIGDILVNSTGVGTLGRVGVILNVDERTVVDSHVTIVRPNKCFLKTNYFIFLMFNNEILFQTMGEGSTGQAELKRENIVRMPILIAPENVQEKFEVITSGHLGEFVLIEKQNYALHTLRDTLLPKLISGELRIKDAEKFIEALS